MNSRSRRKQKKYLSTHIIENKYNVTRHSTNTRENLDNNKEEKIKNIIQILIDVWIGLNQYKGVNIGIPIS